ncbi:MAG: tripartite tricarboxylate transporter TctB family protein [Burkholderiaceae bacterium]
MTQESQDPGRPRTAATRRTLEIITAIAFMLLGSVVMWDAQRIGAGWTDEGPQSGYFPFYIGLLMNGASLINLLKALRANREIPFVSRTEIRLVLAIFLPSVVYVAAMQWVGLYVASAIFIAVFMRWQGKFSVLKSGLTGVIVSVILFGMFEIWFKVPLIKGPLEAALGY